MGQNSSARRRTKKRRTRQLADWRARQAQKKGEDKPAATDRGKPSG